MGEIEKGRTYNPSNTHVTIRSLQLIYNKFSYNQVAATKFAWNVLLGKLLLDKLSNSIQLQIVLTNIYLSINLDTAVFFNLRNA